MKIRTKEFKPNTIIYIATDFKKNKVYTINVTTRKIYSHPQNEINMNIYIAMSVAFAMFLRRFSDQIRARLYLNYSFQNFNILFIGIGILIGLSAFYLGLILKKRQIFHLDEYLDKHPQTEEVNDSNKVIEKALFEVSLTLAIMLGAGLGSVVLFGQFLIDSNLSTYFWAVLAIAISSLSIARINEIRFIIDLKSEKQT